MNTKKKFLTALCTLFLCWTSISAQKTRIYVTTDISSLEEGVAEPDDTQSLVRLLLYANEFEIEGIASTYSSHGKAVYLQYLKEVIDIYGKSWENLKRYGDFPSPEQLLGKLTCGNAALGSKKLGKENDSEASEDIIRVLKENHEKPLWILVWGGSLDVAQALWKMRETLPEKELQQLLSAIRIYAIADQYDDCGVWIRKNFKDVFYILSNVSFRGMYLGGDQTTVSKEWVEDHIKSNPSPLAQLYPNYAVGGLYGDRLGIKEGDTPSFLYLLNGDPEDPTGESWGGSFKKVENTNHFVDGTKEDFSVATETVYKWREDFQADFLKRLSWLK
jgi:hypothetical protein